MIYQRFIPEGWEESRNPVSKEVLEQAMQMGSIMQGVVTKCDADYNLHIDFGNHITGVIPREEVEAVKIGEEGIPNPNICMSKVNQYVQFKVKEIIANTFAFIVSTGHVLYISLLATFFI